MNARRNIMPWSLAVVLALGFGLWSAVTLLAEPSRPLTYPKAKKVDADDEFHGVKVPDPYRWLEWPKKDDTDQQAREKEIEAWIDAENRVTFGYLEQIPEREKIKKRLTDIWNYERYGVPAKRGGRYLFTKNDGLQNQNVLYTVRSLDAKPDVLIDPNALSKDGTIAMSGWDITEDGKLLAYGLATGGSDWQEWKIRNIETGKDTDDHIQWIKWSGASWTRDGKGFFYSRYDEPPKGQELQQVNKFHKLYYHRLGTPQSQNVLVYQRADEPDWGFGGEVTDDGRFLVINIWKGTERKNLIFYQDLQKEKAPIVELIKSFESQFEFIDNNGPVLWLKTDLDAPRSRVIAIDTTNPDRADWKEIIPQAKETLRSVDAVGNHFIASYLKDAHTQVKVFTLDGKPVREVPLPDIGSAWGFGGRRDDPETFYVFTSFTDPGTVYRYDVATGQSTVFRRPKVDFNPDKYETKQIFYQSKDGTRVPMFITHKKGIKLEGTNPTLLYGYGGFDISLTPYFSVTNAMWLEMGGVYAVANIRGGGEYGKEWHDAGKKLNKQNCFDDFIAAAEWLIKNNYTSSRKLAIRGGSNGGLLVGACMTQRPDLFGACLPAVGVMDMLRFHQYTIGWAWTSDYGSPDNPEEFKAMFAYSPLHNLKPGTAYPATLITTADRDDRVVPAHSFKFAAALQEAHSGTAPVLIRIQTQAGHGAGKPTTMRIAEEADVLAFLVKTLEMKID